MYITFNIRALQIFLGLENYRYFVKVNTVKKLSIVPTLSLEVVYFHENVEIVFFGLFKGNNISSYSDDVELTAVKWSNSFLLNFVKHFIIAFHAHLIIRFHENLKKLTKNYLYS